MKKYLPKARISVHQQISSNAHTETHVQRLIRLHPHSRLETSIKSHTTESVSNKWSEHYKQRNESIRNETGNTRVHVHVTAA